VHGGACECLLSQLEGPGIRALCLALMPGVTGRVPATPLFNDCLRNTVVNSSLHTLEDEQSSTLDCSLYLYKWLRTEFTLRTCAYGVLVEYHFYCPHPASATFSVDATSFVH
jgi:hypothetical protein